MMELFVGAEDRPWARLGQLVLDRGTWKGREIVPSAWLAASMSAHNNGPGQFLYGFRWWLGRSFCRGNMIEWAGAMGWAGERLIVVPAQDMIVLVNAWLPDRTNLPESILFNHYILPAVVAA
jgi:CubicO group peptidase (beta-lactamase class C family)